MQNVSITTKKVSEVKSSNVQLENQFNKELKSIYEINHSNKIDFLKSLNNHLNNYIKLFDYKVLKKLVSKTNKNSSEMELYTNLLIFNKENKLQLSETKLSIFNINNIKLLINKFDITKINEFKKELNKIKFDILIQDKINISLQNLINKYLVKKEIATVENKKITVSTKKETEEKKEVATVENEDNLSLNFTIELNKNGTPKNLKNSLENEINLLISKGIKKEELKTLFLELLA